MPEHLRALVVILILAAFVFGFAKRPVCQLLPCADYTRRLNTWFALTLAAFLAHSFWMYAVVAGLILFVVARHESNRVALFFFVLFVIPPASAEIPGFGVINYFFELNQINLLALVILLPAFTVLLRNNTLPLGHTAPDKVLLIFLLLSFALEFRETTITDSLRQGFYLFIGVLVPYFVVSRSLKTPQDFKDALLGFILAVMVLAAIGFFEYSRHWLLYNALYNALGLSAGGYSNYMERADSLRAIASTGHPIALGYVMVVAIGFSLYLKTSIQNKISPRLALGLLTAGLVAPLSRGPWVGAAVLLTTFIATGRFAARRLVMLGLVAIMAVPVLMSHPVGQKMVDVLPFVGTIEKGNIDYRSRLIDNAFIVIQRHPLFGLADYRKTPEMEEMIQGQGIVDVVNTYIGIALHMGLVGLGLFIGFFALVVLGIYKAMRSLPDKNDDMYLLGRSLLATLLAILVIIFTVSSISIIPIVYWSMAGLGVAYIQMVRIRNVATG